MFKYSLACMLACLHLCDKFDGTFYKKKPCILLLKEFLIMNVQSKICPNYICIKKIVGFLVQNYNSNYINSLMIYKFKILFK